jgi:iron(III) transport system substrate-binding protein
MLTLGGCGDDRPVVVLYTAADEYVAREIIHAFEQEHDIRIKYVGDTEVKKTTGLVERLRAEKNNPQADVFWSSEIFMTIELADEGILEPYESEQTRDWPRDFRDEENRWYGFAARGRVIVYAPDRVTGEDIPETWADLTRDRFKGRVVMADPRFGTTGGHLAAKKAFWEREYGHGIYEAYLLGLAENETRMLTSGNAGVVRAVAAGEADVGMTDTDDVWAAQARGLNVELVYPRHSREDGLRGAGTLLIPNTVARVKGGPNPETAAKLIDFLLSERSERILAESVSGNIPLRPGLNEEYQHLHVPDPLRVDFRRAAALRTQAVEQAMRMLRDGISDELEEDEVAMGQR